MYHAHHRRDDAERRHAVGQLRDAVTGISPSLVVSLDFIVHQIFELERIEVARRPSGAGNRS